MNRSEILELMKSKFAALYGQGGEKIFFAPGRVNLIGEHTDYNGGHVFPCALSLGTYAIARRREDKLVHMASLNMKISPEKEFRLDDPKVFAAKGGDDWANYPKGVIWAFAEKGFELPSGMDILYYGNIPAGSGLSSSAALEVLTGVVLRELFGFDSLTNVDLALIGQRAENAYVGMNCGIMDQFASAMGKEAHAILLDTNTLEYEYAPLAMEGMKIVITNSQVKHKLASSAYNTRRSECETAVEKLNAAGAGIKALGELTPEDYKKYDGVLEGVIAKRAIHAITENQRTIDAAKALAENDLVTFGKLQNASHISLRDDYEVSCPEIDYLVDQAWKIDGVLGSRITGGGFGGCTVSIVKEEAVEEFKKTLAANYRKAYDKKAEFYVIDAGEGARMIDG